MFTVGNSLSPTWSVIVKVDRPHVVFRMLMMRLYLVDSSVKTVQTVVGGKREDLIENDRALRWRELEEDEETL